MNENDPATEIVENAGGEGPGRVELRIVIAPPPGAGVEATTAVSAVINNLPSGARPSAGFPQEGGGWALAIGDLEGLTISFPADQAEEWRPDVSVVLQDESGSVDVLESVPPQMLNLIEMAEAGTAAGLVVELDPSVAVDALGADQLVYDVTVHGLPAGAELTKGTVNGDGSWTLVPEELGDVAVVLPEGFSGNLAITFSAFGIDEGGGLRTETVSVDYWTEGLSEALPASGFDFGLGAGHEAFVGGGEAGDAVHLIGLDHGPSSEIQGESDWTLILDDPSVAVTETEAGLEFGGEASGTIVLADGSELTFVDIVRVDW